MGSMPEGRKCLECIGRPVAELRPDALWRGSRVLHRLVSAAEVELVMRSRRECAANQLLADVVQAGGQVPAQAASRHVGRWRPPCSRRLPVMCSGRHREDADHLQCSLVLLIIVID